MLVVFNVYLKILKDNFFFIKYILVVYVVFYICVVINIVGKDEGIIYLNIGSKEVYFYYIFKVCSGFFYLLNDLDGCYSLGNCINKFLGLDKKN